MKKEEVAALIDSYWSSLPPRLPGNQESELVAERIAWLLQTQRAAVVEALRDWIAIRIPESERQDGGGA